MKQKLKKKEKEADENKQALEELKERHECFSSTLDFQSESFTEDIRLAENRQEELDHNLKEIRESLYPLVTKSAGLAEEKKELEKEITTKQKLQERVISQKALTEETGLLLKCWQTFRHQSRKTESAENKWMRRWRNRGPRKST